METLKILCAFILVAVACLVRWLRRGKIEGIPEPNGNYILGHVLQLGGNFSIKFLEWKKTFGPVFQLRLVNMRVIVFNDKESISKICSLTSASGRPRFGVFEKSVELYGAGLGNSEGPAWEEQRQFYQKSFRTFGVGRVATERSLLDQLQQKLLEWEKLDGAPFQLAGCNMAYVFNATWSVLGSQTMEPAAVSKLAHRIASLPKLDTVGHKLALLSVSLAEKFTSAMEEKLDGFRALSAVAAELFSKHQIDRIPGEPRDVIDDILDKMDITQDENSMFHRMHTKSTFAIHEIMYASMDTTSKSLEWLMTYLVRKPQVTAKLYAEIDQVLGDDPDLVPGLSERVNMPYVQACIMEALRMSSIFPVGIPHKALEDLKFNGALIPKGTLLIMNLHGAHYDPEVWDEPQNFEPQRFLTPEGDKINMSAKKKIIPFGTGRRMCPGNVIAEDTMFLFVANVYRKFRFELVGDWVDVEKEKIGFLRYPPEGIQLKAVYRSRK